MKLEIKHLSPYFDYKLKLRQGKTIGEIYSLSKFINGDEYIEIFTKTLIINLQLKDVKPILRPLSDLTKEIEVNGEKFVPAEEMITHGFRNSFWYDLDEFDYRYLYAMDLEKLLEWHFDLFSLIENNLAINVNDIK